MSRGYFRIGRIEPTAMGLWVEVKIKWHRHKTKPHGWSYTCLDGDELQAYKEAVEWCLGMRERHDGMKFEKGHLVQHDWSKKRKET